VTWHKADYVDTVVVCYDKGSRSYAKVEAAEVFRAPGPGSEQHDQTLTEAAARLNALMADIPAPEGRQLGFVRSDQGLVLVWRVGPTDEEYEATYAGRGVELVDEDQISRMFDLEPQKLGDSSQDLDR
jgi:hypothetical protein